MTSNQEGDAPDQWPTIAEAAQALNISERTVRRAAMMPENAARTRQGTRHTKTGTRQATFIAPELVETLREEHRQNAAPELFERGETQATPAEERGETLPTVAQEGQECGTSAATPAEHGADATARAIAERECELLREALQRERENADQWRNQVEAANRDAAELRSALRKALDSMPKQLEPGSGEAAARKATPTTATSETPITASRPAKRQPRPMWKVVLGIR